jgi:hypothetical protein
VCSMTGCWRSISGLVVRRLDGQAAGGEPETTNRPTV